MDELMPINDERLRAVLSYPVFSEGHYSNVLADMGNLAVSAICSRGRVEIQGFRAIGKGCVGIVLVGMVGDKAIALKVLRSDANRASLMHEGEYLGAANGCEVGPRLICCTRTVLAMEYIKGKYLTSWLGTPRAADDVRHLVSELLRQCRCLDRIGLDHGELADAKKHILVDQRGEPCLVDFETASRKRRCKNLVAMVNYLFFTGVSSSVGQYLSWEKTSLVDAIREYKVLPSNAAYEGVLSRLGLKVQ